jgi:hypothetical protein
MSRYYGSVAPLISRALVAIIGRPWQKSGSVA